MRSSRKRWCISVDGRYKIRKRSSCWQILFGGAVFLPDCFYTSGDGKRDGIYDPAQGKRVYADGVKSNMKYGRKTCILPVLYCMIKNTKHVKNMCHRGMKNGDQKCYDFTEDRSGRLIY